MGCGGAYAVVKTQLEVAIENIKADQKGLYSGLPFGQLSSALSAINLNTGKLSSRRGINTAGMTTAAYGSV